MIFDFTFLKYEILCDEIAKSNYKVYTVRDFLLRKEHVDKYIILRHDVDRSPETALLMAKIENKYNIKSTYYFRYIERTFKYDIMKSILDLGHEIGYHYEVLDKANGNYDLAINIFKQELREFRKYFIIETIVQHGSPLSGDLDISSFKGLCNIIKKLIKKENIFSRRQNLDIWNKYNFSRFGISGEAYLSINFEKLFYISDSGGSWSDKYKIKDKAINKNSTHKKFKIKNTDDIIQIIQNERNEGLYFLIHSNHWANNYFEWFINKIIKSIRNTIKLIFESIGILTPPVLHEYRGN
jgi:hypothetical protein